jgi:hypothetical protein
MALSLAALTLLASLTSAEPRTHRAAVEDLAADPVRHHDGFALRLDAGLGYARASPTLDGTGEAAEGVSGQLGVAVGKAMSQDLVLAAHAWGVTSFGLSHGTAYSLVGFGPNLTTYVMPANLFVSITPSATVLWLSQSGLQAETEWGFGGHVSAGKEWAVHGRWGVALLGYFAFAVTPMRSPGASESTTATLTNVGLAMAATFD